MSTFKSIPCCGFRLYDVPGPAWRVTVYVTGCGCSYRNGSMTLMPMASAVVDDFGQLVLVTTWR